MNEPQSFVLRRAFRQPFVRNCTFGECLIVCLCVDPGVARLPCGAWQLGESNQEVCVLQIRQLSDA